MRHNLRDSHFRHYPLAPSLQYFAEPISLRFLNYATFQYLYLFTGVLEEGVYKPGQEVIVRRDMSSPGLPGGEPRGDS